ncbi:alpha-N-arabinofuranosidase [Microbacterium ginsengiterrae]|uniref:Alpha-N-arabinofuranosidase n=1 Tax=Microbacterium ginsengiterrae TaxID=546115 RepID=A0A7W9FBU0_9MICO|nr:glycoside hydrolase family 43 protein [Microbacterium ginsengiterrae]MBB5743532.1 alpha-N-arabinofuranosidase [Microbacterium ginsengiterrae]
MITAANPILPGCHPDPSICRVGDEYFLVTSTFEYLPGLPVMRSTDLVRWETIGHAIDRHGMLDFDGIRSSGGLYAPTIRHDGEVFWIVCTLVDQADPSRGGNFVITADDPAGPWSDPIRLDADGIDPSVAFDADGRVWMHGTRLAREPQWHDQTEVWVREFSRTERALVGEEHVIWRGAVQGVVWAEGPHLYRLDGRWYLVAAEGGTEFHHAVSVARADEVTGPYVGNRANPVLTHRHLGRGAGVIGAGHADLVQAPDGSWHAVMLAMRAADGHHYPLGRETFLCPVTWEDGWPVFAPGLGRLPDEVAIPWTDAAMEEGTWQPDDRRPGLVPADDHRWTSLRVPPQHVARADDDGSWMLPVRTEVLSDPGTVAFLGLRQQHADVDVTCTIETTDLADGETVGFVVRQSERDHAAVQITRTPEGLVLEVVHRQADSEQILLRQDRAFASSVALGVRARGWSYEPVCDGEGLPSVDARTLDAAATGGFLGMWFGVFATSNGRAPRSHVRISDVVYAPSEEAVQRPLP